MSGNIMGYYGLMCSLIVAAPFFVFSKDVIEYRNKTVSKFQKYFWTVFPVLVLVAVSWLALFFTPFLENRIYETKEGTVKEIIYEDKKEGSYNIELEECDTGKVTQIFNVYTETIEAGDSVIIRKFLPMSFGVEKNGEETIYYKKYYDKWLGNTVLDKVVLGLIIVLNMMVHRRKRKSKVERGKIVWNIWDRGCVLFSLVMLGSLWYPVRSFREASVLGGFLMLFYVVYQTAGFAWCLQNAQTVTKKDSIQEQIVFDTKTEDKVISKEVTRVKESEAASYVVTLIELTPEQAKKYCRNKYHGWRNEAIEECLTYQWNCFLGGVFIRLLMESELKRVIIPVTIIVCFFIFIYETRTFNKKCMKIRKASQSLCEYAILPMAEGENIRFQSTDGQNILWRMEHDEKGVLNERQKAAVFYLSSTRQMFTEELKVLEDILR